MADAKMRLVLSGFLALFLLAPSAQAQMVNMTLMHTPPARIGAGEDLKISGNIVGADQVSIAALAYRVEGRKEFEIAELRLIKGDRYVGVIPGKFVKTPAIEYFCYAVDFEGNRRVIFASEQEPQRVQVAALIIAPKPVKPDDAAGKKPKPKIDKKDPKAQDMVAVAARPLHQSSMASGQSQILDRAPAIVAKMDRREIEDMGARTVGDVLDHMAGIYVERNVSGDYHVAMRGMQTDSEVLILLDGHPINNLYSGVALVEWPAEAVEWIEVIRGPGTASFGSGALMGVVNIHSRQGDGFWSSAGYGMFNEARISAGGGYANDALRVGGQVQFMRSEGHDRLVTQDVLSGVKGSIPTELDVSNTPNPVDDGRLQLHGQLHASLLNLAGGELSLMSHYLFQQRGGYMGKSDSLDLGSDLIDHLVQADLRFDLPLTKTFKLETRAWVDMHVVDRDFQVLPAAREGDLNVYLVGDIPLTDGMRERSTYQTLQTGLDLGTRVQLLPNNSLWAGLSFSYHLLPDFTLERDIGSAADSICTGGLENCEVAIQGFSLPVGRFEANPEGKNRIVFGGFVQDHWTDIVPGLDALAAIRLDYFTDAGLAFSPRLALVYGPLEGLDFKALYAMSYRAPSFKELHEDPRFDPLRAFVGIDSLKPVTTNTLEFGSAWRLSAAGVDYRLAANFFMSWIRDSIVGLDLGYGQPSYSNDQSIDLMGTELEGEARFGERSRLFVNSSWFRAKVRILGLGNESYITDIPQMRLNLGLNLGMGKWVNLHMGVRHFSERRNNVRLSMEILNSYIVPATTIVRAGLSSEPLLFDGLVVYAHVTNAFDSTWSDRPPRPDHMTDFLPRTGFAFMVGLAWRPAETAARANEKESRR